MLRDKSLHLLDIIQNSISAGARNIKVALWTDCAGKELFISISDDGCGMSPEMLDSVTSPFSTSRTTRKVGLGIPLFKMSGEITGGGFNIKSKEGEGTCIEVSYVIDHIDRIPLGDLGDAICTSIMANEEIDYEISLDNSKEQLVVSTVEVKEQLSPVKISNYEVLQWLREYINEKVKVVFKGVL